MNYIEYDFTVSPTEMGAEILTAELAEVGFDSFVDTPTGVKAYISRPLEGGYSGGYLSVEQSRIYHLLPSD